MNDEDVYDQWVQQRREANVSDDFTKRVVAQLPTRAKPERTFWERPLVAAAAIVVASFAGLVRVAMTLLIGLHAN